MGGNKTRDGIKLTQIVKLLAQLPGVEIRAGTNHPFIAKITGHRPCPLATSTDAKKMVTPWVAEATGMSRDRIYTSLREGTWYQPAEA